MRWLWTLALALIAVATATAQTATAGQAIMPVPADTVRVRLVTFVPGREAFEVYGHTELRVTQGDEDYYFNYGVFDFTTPGFMWRFVLGHTDYLCVPVTQEIAMLGNDGRRMVEQDLNLTQAQARAIRNALVDNVQPANRTYRYHYFHNNCSTRPRDIIEAALGDSLRYDEAVPDIGTFRDVVTHYSRNYAWTLFGIDLALGSAIDRKVTFYDRMFVPMLLMDAMAHATVTRDGRPQPVVTATRVLIDGPEEGLVEPPTPWWAQPLTVAIVLLVVTAALTARDVRRRHMGRVTSTVIFTAYGLAGVLIWFLTFVSTHEGTAPNYNALWLHPFYLIAAVAVWCKPRPWHRVLYTALALVALGTLAAWPLLPQVGHPAFFPLMILVALRAAAHAWIKPAINSE